MKKRKKESVFDGIMTGAREALAYARREAGKSQYWSDGDGTKIIPKRDGEKSRLADQIKIYVFRDKNFAPAGDTMVSAAPIEAVVSVYGGGGIKDTGGLVAAFDGAAVFREDSTGARHAGVWGARKASRFRNALRKSGLEIEVVNSPPPGRLVWYSSK